MVVVTVKFLGKRAVQGWQRRPAALNRKRLNRFSEGVVPKPLSAARMKNNISTRGRPAMQGNFSPPIGH